MAEMPAMEEFPALQPLGFRKDRLTATMQEKGIDGILLASPENVFYTTGYPTLPSCGNPILYALRRHFPFFSLITRDGEVTLICWDFSAFGVKFGADSILGFSTADEARRTLRTLLKDAVGAGRTIAIESAVPYGLIEQIKDDLAPKQILPADEYILDLRLVKSDDEIRLLSKCLKIAEQTTLELFGLLRLGMSRLELLQEAKARLLRNGATGVGHLTYSFAKANPEIALGETLGPNRLAFLDTGAILDGYVSDMRRDAYTGDVPDATLDHYHKMIGIVDEVGSHLKPGARYSDIFKRAASLYREQGIEPPMGHLSHVGHNIGLETEDDWIADSPDKTVRAGMVINIELFSFAPTGDYVGTEETYVVGAGGSTRITTLPREIHRV